MSYINLPSGGNELHKARYLAFIESRPDRGHRRQIGFELHHICPRSLGGSQKKSNLILLTPREHYIAHLILWKTYGGSMTYAFFMMACRLDYRFKNVLSARQYENVRRDLSTIRTNFKYSLESRNKMSKSASLRPRLPLTEETKKKIGEANKGKISLAKGKTKSEETKARMRKAQENRKPISEETRNRLIKSHMGKKQSAESCKKKSESCKKAWAKRKQSLEDKKYGAESFM
jgi:hypothetical protein